MRKPYSPMPCCSRARAVVGMAELTCAVTEVVDEQIDVARDAAKPAGYNHSFSRELRFAHVRLTE